MLINVNQEQYSALLNLVNREMKVEREILAYLKGEAGETLGETIGKPLNSDSFINSHTADYKFYKNLYATLVKDVVSDENKAEPDMPKFTLPPLPEPIKFPEMPPFGLASSCEFKRMLKEDKNGK